MSFGVRGKKCVHVIFGYNKKNIVANEQRKSYLIYLILSKYKIIKPLSRHIYYFQAYSIGR